MEDRFPFGVNTVITGIPNGAGSVMQYVFDDLTGEFVLTAEDPGKDVVKNNIVKLWYHHNRLGSTDFLTDNVKGKVTSFVSYDDWGAPTMKAVLRMGVRELDLVTEYTGHPMDMVLGIYFAEARMYDAADRRFMAMDTVGGSLRFTTELNSYTYVKNNPHLMTDPDGLYFIVRNTAESGYEYYEIIKQTWVDANLFEITSFSYQAMYHDVVAGSSANLSTIDILEGVGAIDPIANLAAATAIAYGIPFVREVMIGYKAIEVIIGASNAKDILNRDNVIFDTLADISAPTVFSVKSGVAIKFAELDKYIDETPAVFDTQYGRLGDRSIFEFARELSYATDESLTKIKQEYYSSVYSAVLSYVLDGYFGMSRKFWDEQISKYGAQTVGKTIVDVRPYPNGMMHPPTAEHLALIVMAQMWKEETTAYLQWYNEYLAYFKALFCPNNEQNYSGVR